MLSIERTKRIAVAVTAGFLMLSGLSPAGATGPRGVTDSGRPIKWPSMPVRVDLESDLNVRGKDIEPLVSEALSEWTSITEANVSFDLRDLGAAVDDSNICDFFVDVVACPGGPENDGTNPLVIDEDGQIVADFFGDTARFTTLGFASIVGADLSSGNAIKGEAVFNAACLNEVEILPGCATVGLSFSNDDFTSFIVHEMGHFLGLDHSQVNLDEATDDDPSNDDRITTMYPRFLVGNGADFKTPERDDRVGLAQLYPSSSFDDNHWTIEGTAFNAAGTTPVQCANLVARNVDNPRGDAISALSGDFSPSGAADGDFVILGLIPGETYTLDFEAIDPSATGASGYTPCRGTAGEPKPPAVASFTASDTYTESAGGTVTLDCQAGDDCAPGAGGGSSGGGAIGGCSLVR